ncbi:peptidoglycan-binding protein [Aetokthonos hydrillicola Thurmond2011]|uniref:Peptidoglycan-binding protein n=1 Tax=Aetokthonos hydrillicola Thurmond2011 TaxID=2712845 RepID=A0AAP5IF26_9CYAN|nr:peptidoglycan-binding protein [Aetokthonos hydrillicola]MBO3461328.1 peptidoglycan-binding protein [Aetokthonos hydrillicola CCALA 1050]MBW4589275.1 peptidoglycan-binding protein [Aetokthonos hydrillicola CCALA 1050]MDR9900460.1 peptidoglycan-binding protein [Aetokthonos hydrillicola Thurmond2011]
MEYLAYSHLVLANTEANPDTEYSLPEIKFNISWKKHFKSAWLTFASIGLLAAILSHTQVASAAYYDSDRYFVSTQGGSLNIRDYPSSNAKIVGKYYNGAQLPRIIGFRNGFAHLSTGYWVSANWISSSSDYRDTYRDRDGYRDRDRDRNGYRNKDRYTNAPSVGGQIHLSYGSQGPLVWKLQRRLGIRGTGFYDYTTVDAVRRYQRSVGLYPDGVVGPTTASSLFE